MTLPWRFSTRLWSVAVGICVRSTTGRVIYDLWVRSGAGVGWGGLGCGHLSQTGLSVYLLCTHAHLHCNVVTPPTAVFPNGQRYLHKGNNYWNVWLGPACCVNWTNDSQTHTHTHIFCRPFIVPVTDHWRSTKRSISNIYRDYHAPTNELHRRRYIRIAQELLESRHCWGLTRLPFRRV